MTIFYTKDIGYQALALDAIACANKLFGDACLSVKEPDVYGKWAIHVTCAHKKAVIRVDIDTTDCLSEAGTIAKIGVRQNDAALRAFGTLGFKLMWKHLHKED
jgi:hypothetical protein